MMNVRGPAGSADRAPVTGRWVLVARDFGAAAAAAPLAEGSGAASFCTTYRALAARRAARAALRAAPRSFAVPFPLHPLAAWLPPADPRPPWWLPPPLPWLPAPAFPRGLGGGGGGGPPLPHRPPLLPGTTRVHATPGRAPPPRFLPGGGAGGGGRFL
jgi:hypothetical protein